MPQTCAHFPAHWLPPRSMCLLHMWLLQDGEIREVQPVREDTLPRLQARQEMGHHTLPCQPHKTPELTYRGSNQTHQQTIKALSDHLFDPKNHKKPMRPLLAQTWREEQRSNLHDAFNQESDSPLFN